MKKIFKSLFFLSIFCILLKNSCFAAEFKDIENDEEKDKIIYLCDCKILNGVNENEFCPDNNVTRAEFCAVLARLCTAVSDKQNSAFSDVTSSDWFYSDVNLMSEMGIVNGYGDIFKPNEYITREQSAKILVSYYEFKMGKMQVGAYATVFDDFFDISDWAREYVQKATALQIAKGQESLLTFKPKDYTTRSQMASMVYALKHSLDIESGF